MYTRTELSSITRAVNRGFPMPVMLLFRHGDTISLSVIHRRLHKRQADRDVLEKVTLVKEIQFTDPLRAHIEILNDLSLSALHDEYRFHNFVGLHLAWEKRLDSYALNKRFYREIADWYFWALTRDDVVLPRSIEEIGEREERDKQRAVFFMGSLCGSCWRMVDISSTSYTSAMNRSFPAPPTTFASSFSPEPGWMPAGLCGLTTWRSGIGRARGRKASLRRRQLAPASGTSPSAGRDEPLTLWPQSQLGLEMSHEYGRAW